MNTTAITITEKENTLFKSFKSRTAAMHAITTLDRRSKVYAFVIADAWQQLKELYQTEDCTLKDMCEWLGENYTSVCERIKVIEKIPREYYGTYTITQLVEISRLKNVDFREIDIYSLFPYTLTTKEIRKLVKGYNEAIDVDETESAADDTESAADDTESAADDTDSTAEDTESTAEETAETVETFTSIEQVLKFFKALKTDGVELTEITVTMK